jgi:4-amino-4-deoxy-L-arabinose transferase-like glycosyltransferase
MRSQFNRRLAVVVVLGLAVRVAYVLVVMRHRELGFDANWYHDMANTISEGRGYQVRCRVITSCEYRPTAYFPPLFPLLLSLPSRLGATSLTSHQLFACGVGACTVAAVGFLGRRLGGASVGLLAAGIAAVYPMFFAADGAPMSESLYLLVVTSVLLAALRALERPTVRRWAILGLLIGAAALTRGEGLALLIVALPVGAALRRESVSRRLALSGVAVVVSLAVVSPWIIRNSLTFGELVPVSTNANTVVRGANCPATYRGPMIGYWSFDCLRLGIDPLESLTLDEVQSGHIIRREGIRYASNNKGRLVAVSAVRVLRTWGVFDPPQQVRLEAPASRTVGGEQAGWAMYAALFPLALIGLVVVHRGPARWPLIAVGVVVTLQTLLTYGAQRWRATAEPVIVTCAALTIVALVGHRRRRSHGARRKTKKRVW